MASYLRVSLKGALPGGEVWSVNPVWKFATPAAIDATACAAYANAAANQAIPTSVTDLMSGTTTFTGARVEAREADGTLERVAEVLRVTPTAGTGAQGHPFQTSLVYSLLTASASASAKGRMYWPATGILTSTTTLRANLTTVSNALTGMKSYLALITTGLNAVPGASTLALNVWSPKNGSGTLVTSLRAGDVLDVQRRRRDRIIENYQSITL